MPCTKAPDPCLVFNLSTNLDIIVPLTKVIKRYLFVWAMSKNCMSGILSGLDQASAGTHGSDRQLYSNRSTPSTHNAFPFKQRNLKLSRRSNMYVLGAALGLFALLSTSALEIDTTLPLQHKGRSELSRKGADRHCRRPLQWPFALAA